MTIPADVASTNRPSVDSQPVKVKWRDYGLAFIGCAIACGIGAPLYGSVELANIIMVFLLAVVGAGVWLGRGPAVFAAVVSVAAFDCLF